MEIKVGSGTAAFAFQHHFLFTPFFFNAFLVTFFSNSQHYTYLFFFFYYTKAIKLTLSFSSAPSLPFSSHSFPFNLPILFPRFFSPLPVT